MEAIAKAKYLKGSPRKARLVIDLIRGRNVSQALAILKFTNKRAAQPIAKCLNSAIANATFLAEQKNIAIDPDDLWVRTCFVDMGPTKNRRRMRPAPQGRAYREQRHYCHITIAVTSDENPEVTKKAALKAEAEKGKNKPAETKAQTAKPKKEAKTETRAAKIDANVEDAKTPETTAEETASQVTESIETQVETPETPAEVAETETPETPAENKPFAAQNDEEQSGTKMADDAKIDKVEELERQ